MTVSNFWLLIAAVNGGVAAVAGAYGWHWIDTDDALRDTFNAGVQYHMWHALALLGVAWLADKRDGKASAVWVRRTGWLFTIGMVLFSGSLYAYGLIGELVVPGAAPAGGLALIAAWISLAVTATQKD